MLTDSDVPGSRREAACERLEQTLRELPARSDTQQLLTEFVAELRGGIYPYHEVERILRGYLVFENWDAKLLAERIVDENLTKLEPSVEHAVLKAIEQDIRNQMDSPDENRRDDMRKIVRRTSLPRKLKDIVTLYPEPLQKSWYSLQKLVDLQADQQRFDAVVRELALKARVPREVARSALVSIMQKPVSTAALVRLLPHGPDFDGTKLPDLLNFAAQAQLVTQA